MPQVLAARVTCPNCSTQFQVPLEQLLDVRADPGAKVRLLNGLVNMAVCPNCRTGGPLNLPFLYHDPDKELALVLMPMELGRDNLERQQAIGKLTNAVMNSLPPEERKGYLLQPQVFFTLENLVNRVLEADGVTPEMLEEQRARASLLQRMLDATSDQVLEAMIRENDQVIDSSFLRMLTMNVEIAQATGQETGIQSLLALRQKLMEWSTEGRRARTRGEMLEALRAEPTRETLLDLLVQAPDEPSRELLVVFGRPLMDYPFFQALTSRVESASGEDERARLVALRSEVLAVRDRLDEETRALYEERSALLRDLLLSENPQALARRRAHELDEAFFNVLAANLREARAAGDETALKSLQAIWGLMLRLMEASLPPEVQLLNRLMAAQDEAEMEQLLQENRDLVTESLVQYLEEAQVSVQGEEAGRSAERLALVLGKVRAVLAQGEIALPH